ncbi:class I SAM-dependent methyltransferase [Thalassobacillus hwangdonensis]|uniref:Class I SAM-dependent methyltransferase n=1 Tax=Thalassobacillus hwangdonensis TaxID=546108 RepID=A0ABW3L2F5_9BACI
MPIDFHNEANRYSYSGRSVDPSWVDLFQKLVDTYHIEYPIDIGCGGGIYSRVLASIGTIRVLGLDQSAPIINTAKQHSDDPRLSFQQGDALCTGLPSSSHDMVLQRALVHHINNLEACVKEANRLLNTEGIYVIQDRTPEDCFLPGSSQHIRGYFFEKYPQLKKLEKQRRHTSQKVKHTLEENGFLLLKEHKFWEVRRNYENKVEWKEELLSRKGRSILHELKEDELLVLEDMISPHLPESTPIVEKDRWTIWISQKRS